MKILKCCLQCHAYIMIFAARSNTRYQYIDVDKSYYLVYDICFYLIIILRIDYGGDGAIHALVHLNLNSSALDYPN